MKDVGVKISKRKSGNCVSSFDDVLNNINNWLAEKNGENDQIGNNLDELSSEEDKINSNPSEECLVEHQQSEETEDNVNWQQRCRRRKQFTRN